MMAVQTTHSALQHTSNEFEPILRVNTVHSIVSHLKTISKCTMALLCTNVREGIVSTFMKDSKI